MHPLGPAQGIAANKQQDAGNQQEHTEYPQSRNDTAKPGGMSHSVGVFQHLAFTPIALQDLMTNHAVLALRI